MAASVDTLAALRDLDVGRDAAQVAAVCGFCDVPDFGGLAGPIVNGLGAGQGDGVIGDTRYIPVARRVIIATDTDHQAIGISVRRVRPCIGRVDVVLVA